MPQLCRRPADPGSRPRTLRRILLGLDGDLPWFNIDMSKLPDAASRVVTEIETNYPSGNVPFHSRWRHFEQGGTDLWADMAAARGLTGSHLAVAAGDLAIVSVLLDAGAGPDWIYTDDATGLRLGRSEGLALASLRLFESGLLSADKNEPLRADASALSSWRRKRWAGYFKSRMTIRSSGWSSAPGCCESSAMPSENVHSLYARTARSAPAT